MFQSARIKLTAWYLMIVVLLCVAFSGVVYQMLMHEVVRFEQAQRFRIERRLEGRPFSIPVNVELVEETRKRILINLALINAVVWVMSGALSYFLAGRTLEPIAEMVEKQDRFVSDASHELRTPLTSLKSAFEVYLRGKNKSMWEARRVIRDSIAEVDKLKYLSESLLILARGRKTKIMGNREEIQIEEMLEQCVSKATLIARGNKIKLDRPDTKCVVRGERYGLESVVMILLDNAIKYGKDKGTISVGVTKGEGLVKVWVKNEGEGVAKEELGLIFERFYRTDKARQKNGAGGYGLGLSIAKKIVEEHSGKIYADSQAGRGITFFVELPSFS